MSVVCVFVHVCVCMCLYVYVCVLLGKYSNLNCYCEVNISRQQPRHSMFVNYDPPATDQSGRHEHTLLSLLKIKDANS